MAGRFVAIVQARLGSSRLPAKMLHPLCGRAVILRVVDRLRAVRSLDGIVVGVPDTPEDRPLVEFLREAGVDAIAWPGDPNDLLGRYIGVARARDADGILMVDGDCPLLDPDTCERMLAALRTAPEVEYVRIAPPSIEGGVACLRRATFERIDREGAVGPEREHATLRILERPQDFAIADIAPDPMFADPADTHRFWLDTPADLLFLESVLSRLERRGSLVDLRDVVRLLREEPSLRALNGHVLQRDPRAACRWVALLPPELEGGRPLFSEISEGLSERHRLGVRTFRGPDAVDEAARLGADCVVVASDDPRLGELTESVGPNASIALAEPGSEASVVVEKIGLALAPEPTPGPARGEGARA